MGRSNAILGCTGLTIWIVLFGAGLTIDSRPYREMLSPSSKPAGAVAAAIPVSTDVQINGPESVQRNNKFASFLAALLLYTPLNAAILTVLSGLIGGCASRITYSRLRAEDLDKMGNPEVARLRQLFRTESPVASALRSFLAYIAFIAGIYVASNNPFGDPTPEQYVRVAGTLSFLGFVVGYDPTRLHDLLRLVPGAARKGS